MTKHIIAAFGFAASTFFCAGAAQATIIASNTTAITTTAQEFSKTFALDGTKYTGVTVSVTAKGDYGTNYTIFDDEYFNFFIEGYQVAHWSNTSGSGVSVTENYRDYDYTLSGSFSLTDSQWAAVSADKQLTIAWKNGSGVKSYALGGADYVSFSIDGSLMPSTTPISTTPVTSTPVATTPVVTAPVASTPTATTPTTVVSNGGSAGSTKDVPEPASIALLGLGLAGLGFMRRRRNA